MGRSSSAGISTHRQTQFVDPGETVAGVNVLFRGNGLRCSDPCSVVVANRVIACRKLRASEAMSRAEKNGTLPTEARIHSVSSAPRESPTIIGW